MLSLVEVMKEWVKSNFYLCDCSECDCHYIKNDCKCNTSYHYEFFGDIHWIQKL